MENRTYRYFNGVPLYPFGYGLSYSHFRYTALSITPLVITADDVINIEITLVNDGPYDGDEVKYTIAFFCLHSFYSSTYFFGIRRLLSANFNSCVSYMHLHALLI